jgi:predicted acetyltransferase
MALSLRWVSENDLDAVARARWLSYGHAENEFEKYQREIREDPRAAPSDFLLAERDGQPVGTATSMSLTMWLRGAAISCQGVAYVGAIKTGRRRAISSDNPGVATAVMLETLRKARERQQIVTALMPFRTSYYEHFGYGIVERRARWTIPLSTLNTGDCDGWRLLQAADHPALAAAWQAQVEIGQCDIERSSARWDKCHIKAQEGMYFILRATIAGPIRTSAYIEQHIENEKRVLDVRHWSADSVSTFKSLLCFLATLRDQFSIASIETPIDWPIHRLLREPQLPHRLVEHAHARMDTITRMQLRILDHARFLQSLRLPTDAKGKVNLAVHETEGQVSRFQTDFDTGRATVKPSTAATDFECLDRHWASIATGDITATEAVRFGLASENTAGAAKLLDVLAAGPKPFSREYF